MHRVLVAFLCCVLTGLTGCSKPAASGVPTSEGPVAVPTAGPNDALAPAVPEPGAVARSWDEVGARALLTTWLTAQNEGRFNDYAALYGPRFTGVRRTGARTVRLNHDGWLKDRGRMFRKKMIVEAASPVFMPAGGTTALVSFTQTWASGSYRDVGIKQMVLVLEGSAWRIGREELMQSAVLGGDAQATPLAQGAFSFVLEAGGTRYVVIDANASTGWAQGPAVLRSDDHPRIVTRPVAPAQLPGAVAAWSGRSVRLLGKAGVVCTGRIADISLMARVEPHFGTRDEDQNSSKATIAKETWDAAVEDNVGAPPMAVGRVVPDAGSSCAGAVFAQDASHAVAQSWPETPVPNALRAAALQRFRELRGVAALQTEYRVDSSGGFWEVDKARVTLKAFAGPSGRLLVAAAADAGPGCGDFGGSYSGLWEVAGDGTMTLLSRDPGNDRAFLPLAVADIDGDGAPECVGGFDMDWMLVRRVGPVWDATDNLACPNFDCPC